MDSIFIIRKSFIYVGYFVLFINVILYSLSFKRQPLAYKYIYFYLLLSFIIQITSSYLASIKQNNLFFLHVFFIGQYILLSLFFSLILNNKILKKILTYSSILIPLILVIVYIFNQDLLFRFNIAEILICSIPLLVASFTFFIEKIDSKNKMYIFFNSGFFLYLICSTLIFSAGNNKAQTLSLLWLLNSLIYLCYQILIFIEWYKNLKKHTLFNKK